MKDNRLFVLGIIFILLALLIAIPCHAEWSKREKGMYITYALLSGVDALQSSQSNRNELNPLFTDRHGRPDMDKIIIGKVIGGIVVWGIADRYPKQRKGVLWGAIGVQGVVVGMNF